MSSDSNGTKLEMKNRRNCQTWWHMTTIPPLRGQGKEDQEFEASLGHNGTRSLKKQTNIKTQNTKGVI
jgi:hypothetical protein